MKVVNVGIIGQGRSGHLIHSNTLVKDSRYRVVAVADPIAHRRDAGAERHNATAYADHSKLLARDDLDLVINATMSQQHVPVTLEALQAGHNVLCEKPLAATVAEVDALIAASQKSGKLLAIFQQARFGSYFRQVKQVIDSGVLGRIVQISIAFNGHARRWDWQTIREFNGGNLANTGPHPLDQALVLFGDGEPDVFCRMDRTEGTAGNAENHVKLLLSGQGHPLIDLEISSCCAYPCFTYQVYGSRGGLKASTTEATWRFYDPSQMPPLTLQREPLADANGNPLYGREDVPWQERQWPATATASDADSGSGYVPLNPDSNMTQDFYSMLYQALTAGAPLEVTPAQIRRQIAVIEECRRQNPHIYKV